MLFPTKSERYVRDCIGNIAENQITLAINMVLYTGSEHTTRDKVAEACPGPARDISSAEICTKESRRFL